MSKIELQNEIVRKTEELPEELVKEVLDFAEFLLTRQIKTSSEYVQSDLRSISSTEISHLEEEFIDYKIAYPKLNA